MLVLHFTLLKHQVHSQQEAVLPMTENQSFYLPPSRDTIAMPSQQRTSHNQSSSPVRSIILVLTFFFRFAFIFFELF